MPELESLGKSNSLTGQRCQGGVAVTSPIDLRSLDRHNQSVHALCNLAVNDTSSGFLYTISNLERN